MCGIRPNANNYREEKNKKGTNNRSLVNDMFFDFERGQKLGLWVLAIDSGLLLGPTCVTPYFLISISI